MPRNHSVCIVYAVFLFLEVKEAVKVIEASDVITSAEVIEATKRLRFLKSIIYWLESPYTDVFLKIIF